jgi:hypothetical protein
MASKDKYSVNLLGYDAKLFAKVKMRIERRVKVKISTIQVFRLALQSLAEEEGVK